jgi:hypothetical protein
MDLTEPIPAIAPPPESVLRLAVLVGVSGVVALLAAVGVLIWTYTGMSRPASQPETVTADMASKPIAAAPAGVLAPNPAPTAPSSVSAPASAPTMTVPTVAWPNGEVPNVDWNAVGSTLGLQNLDWTGLFWANSGADATTSAVIGAATSIGNDAVNFMGNNAFNLLNTLILANSGYYGRGPSLPGLGLPDPQQAVTALAASAAVIPQIGPPQLPGVGIGLPGTPIGIGF